MEKSHENVKAFGCAARDTSGVLSPFNFSRRVTGEKDVQFKVMCCGICHSDLHQLKNEWSNCIYPLVPGRQSQDLNNIMCVIGRKLVAGSRIGGMKETQEMVDFAAKHNITPDVEVVPMDYVNTALERLLKSDMKYRFVFDIGNTLNKN